MSTPYSLDSFSDSSVVETFPPSLPTSNYTVDQILAQKPEGFFFKDPIPHLSDRLEAPDISLERFGTSTIQFYAPAYSATEITDNYKVIGVTLDLILTEPVTVDWAVTGGTAVDLQDYTIAGGTSGTLTFNRNEWIKFIPVNIISNALAKPARTIELTLSNPIGSGNYFPKFVLYSNPSPGQYVQIAYDPVNDYYNYHYFYFGTDITIGATKEETAQNIVSYYNTVHGNPNVVATAIGNEVRFELDFPTDRDLIFSTDSPNLLTYLGNYKYFVSGVHDWTLSLGAIAQTIITIEGHPAQPGVTMVLSYNPTTKTINRVSQIPTTSVIQLQETLDNFSQRLQNMGF
jgi:hypothetical protein